MTLFITKANNKLIIQAITNKFQSHARHVIIQKLPSLQKKRDINFAKTNNKRMQISLSLTIRLTTKYFEIYQQIILIQASTGKQ